MPRTESGDHARGACAVITGSCETGEMCVASGCRTAGPVGRTANSVEGNGAGEVCFSPPHPWPFNDLFNTRPKMPNHRVIYVVRAAGAPLVWVYERTDLNGAKP